MLAHVGAAMQVLSEEAQVEFTQVVHAEERVFPVATEIVWSGSAQPPPSVELEPPLDPPLEPPLELLLLSPPPSSSLPKPPPLLFDEHAIAAPNEPAITAVHATALSIAAS